MAAFGQPFFWTKKMKYLITQLLPLSLLVLMVSCGENPENKYDEGFTEGRAQGQTQGYDEGYDKGHTDGDAVGYERAKAYFESAGYDEGKTDGSKLGYGQGYANGWSVGNNETRPVAYSTGYAAGNADGKEDGYARGLDDGYDDGWDQRNTEVYNSGYSVGFKKGEADSYNRGYTDGEDDGYDTGHDDGADDGYDLGYDDGFDDGYDIGFEDGEWDAFSIGKSKKLKGYANLISLAHNDMIDYTKIQMPKSTRKGLVAKGQVLFSESSLTNKDTMKRLAVAEQYLVMEMAKQVKGKFGLSAERSLKLAKASNHFRKYSSTRALTSEDTNAYASEIIGSDFRAIERAYENSMRGDVSGFNSILSKAAEKNETSPENISMIIAKFFM